MHKKFFESRGLTLVEVLLATMIFAIVSLSIAASFRAGVFLYSRLEQTNRLAATTRQVLDQVTHDYSRAVCYDFTGSYEQNSCFKAENGAVSFIIPTGQGLQYIEYRLMPETQGLVKTTTIGQRTDRNIRVDLQRETGTSSWVLVREQQPLSVYFEKNFDGASSNVVLRSLAVEGLKITVPKIGKKTGLPAQVVFQLTVNAGQRTKIVTQTAFNPTGQVEVKP